VTCFTVPFLKPATKNPLYNALAATAPGRTLIEAAATAYLERQLRRLGVEPHPVLLVSNIYCPGSLSPLRPKLILYDFNDHPLQFAGVRPWAERYWRATLDQVDTLFVVSEYYRRELAAQTSKPLVLLGNGVEFGAFAHPRPEPPELAALPRPRIGYLGLLSHFLDFDTLEALRQARGTGTLVLIGPDTPATAPALADFCRREGVARLGQKPYAEVPACMQALDVGVVPFRANMPFVRGINPNKIYQYLAAGIPVVTTPVLDLPPAPPVLQFAATPDEMAGAVRAALAARPDRASCRALARSHDWDAIAGRMVATIEERLAGVS
jgi:glycosyltransferase involved in cell wall biosynthesis